MPDLKISEMTSATTPLTGTEQIPVVQGGANRKVTVSNIIAIGGTVTTASVTSANGFAGTVATATTTPAITLSTTITGIIKGNGTALSAAVVGSDYAPATTGTSILYGDGAGGFSSVTVGSGLSFSTGTLSSTSSGGSVTTVSVASANGLAGTVATASSTPVITLSTSITGLLKGNGTAISAATAGTDYAAATTGTNAQLLANDGSGGFSNVTVGSGLTYSAGTLASSAGGGSVTTVSVSSANGFAGTVANASSTPAITLSTSITGILQGNGTAISAITVGSGLSFVAGTLSSTSGGGSVTSVDVSGGTTGLTTSGGPITGSGTITLAGTLAVANGGTGVTASSGASSVVLRDSNQNIFVNAIRENSTSTVTSGTLITLTVASSPVQVLTGTTAQNINLPDATTLPVGALFLFNNNSTATTTVRNQSSVNQIAYTAGMAGFVILKTNSTADGTWDYYSYLPSNVQWGTASLSATSTAASFSSVTLGTPLTAANGGTGISSLGTGVATALGINVGSAGAFVTLNGSLGTPSSGTLTNATGLPISTGVAGLGTGVATALAINTGSTGAFVVQNGALGTPSSGTLTSATGLPISTGVAGLGTGVATALAVNTGSAGAVVVNGGALGTPSSGIASSMTVDGTDAVGFRNVPISSKSANYTTVLADSGKAIFHPSTDANARTFTIDSNANVAYPLGTALTFINQTSQVVSIAITTDTMTLANTTTTGTRSLAQNGIATAIKVATTAWIISGNGLT